MTEDLRESIHQFAFSFKPTADICKLQSLLDVVTEKQQTAVTIEDCDEAKRRQVKEMSQERPAGKGPEPGCDLRGLCDWKSRPCLHSVEGKATSKQRQRRVRSTHRNH